MPIPVATSEQFSLLGYRHLCAYRDVCRQVLELHRPGESFAYPKAADGTHMVRAQDMQVRGAGDLAQGKCWEMLADRSEL